MSPTNKPPAKRTGAKGSAAKQAHARCRENERAIRKVLSSLETAQGDLAKLRGDLGSGVGDARKSLTRLLRDARRDATKLGNATRKDLERLQKDMLAAAKAAPKRAGARKPAAKAARKPAAAKAAPKRASTRKAAVKAAAKRPGARKARGASTGQARSRRAAR
jgi:peptidoglycan hydrolase CwlO-like protein